MMVEVETRRSKLLSYLRFPCCKQRGIAATKAGKHLHKGLLIHRTILCRDIHFARYAQLLKASRTYYYMFVGSLHAEDCLQDTSSSQGMTEIPLQCIGWNLRQASSLNGDRFHLVVEEGRCAMCIDEAYIFGLHIPYGFLQTSVESFACLAWRTDMKGVVLDVTSPYLPCVFMRKSSSQHDGGCSLS